MQKTNERSVVNAHRRVKSSTTLNRKYVKKPSSVNDISVSIDRSPKIRHFTNQVSNNKAKRVVTQEKVVQHPLQITANEKLRARQTQNLATSQVQKKSAKELKEQAIRKALSVASKTEINQTDDSQNEFTQKDVKFKFGFPRVLLALSCAAIAVVAIVYFVNINMPDISLKVAAMQTGFDATYPNYVPRDYNLAGITSEDNKIVLEFKKASSGEAFTLVEEKSYWDSNALLENYVKGTYEDNYVVIKEQGLTIYINNSNAVWVNGGVLYIITDSDGHLNSSDLHDIAVSL